MNTKLQPNLEIINATKTRLIVSDCDGNMSYLSPRNMLTLIQHPDYKWERVGINKGVSVEYWIEVYKPSII